MPMTDVQAWVKYGAVVGVLIPAFPRFLVGGCLGGKKRRLHAVPEFEIPISPGFPSSHLCSALFLSTMPRGRSIDPHLPITRALQTQRDFRARRNAKMVRIFCSARCFDWKRRDEEGSLGRRGRREGEEGEAEANDSNTLRPRWSGSAAKTKLSRPRSRRFGRGAMAQPKKRFSEQESNSLRR